MNTETLTTDIHNHFSAHNIPAMPLQELREFTTALLKKTTLSFHNELEDLIAQKEQIERQIARKSDELQQLKYRFFDILEKLFAENEAMLEKLHQIKIQSVDLLDILEEMVESAIITTLEKGSDIEETLHEIIKEITFETLNANVLNAVRIRRILASILQTALNIADATPNQADTILRGTLLGIRSSLYKSIEKFHQYLLYVPEEVKALYRAEYKTIEVELDNIDTLFIQVIHSLKNRNSPIMIEHLETISDDIRFDTEEIKHLSKETVELLRNRLSKLTRNVSEKSAKLLNSKSAQEAKAMGARAWSVAKSAMDGAIKGAKDAMDKK
jgi:hypothetical protein